MEHYAERPVFRKIVIIIQNARVSHSEKKSTITIRGIVTLQ